MRRSLLPFHRASPTDASTRAAPCRGASRAVSAMPRAASSRLPAVTTCRRGSLRPNRRTLPACCSESPLLLALGREAAGEAASKRGRAARVHAGGRAGGRAEWAQSATHLLVARRLDATAVRDPGCLVVWRARAALVACMVRLTRCRSAVGGALATDGADADRPRPARAGGEQCSQSAALATTVLSRWCTRCRALERALAARPGVGKALRAKVRCRAALSRCVVELRCRAVRSSSAVELRCRAFVLPSG